MNLPNSRDLKFMLLGIFAMAMFLLIIPTEQVKKTQWSVIDKESNVISIDEKNNPELTLYKKCISKDNLGNGQIAQNILSTNSLYKIEMPTKITLKKYHDADQLSSNSIITLSVQAEIYDNEAIEEQLNIEQENAGLIKAEKEYNMLKLAKALRQENVSNDQYIAAKEEFELAELKLATIQDKINSFKEKTHDNQKIKINLSIPNEIAQKLMNNKIIKKTISYKNQNNTEFVLDNGYLTLNHKDGQFSGIIEVTKNEHNKDFFNKNRNKTANLIFYIINNLLDKNQVIYSIPKTAIISDEHNNYVWKFNPDQKIVSKHKIRVINNIDTIDVLEDINQNIDVGYGLNTGEIIIIDPNISLKDGQKIALR